MDFYTLSRLLPDIVSPLAISLMCLGLALYLKSRVYRTALITISLALLLTFSSPWTSQWLIQSMESRYPAVPIEELPNADVAILLGGGLNVPAGGLPRAELGTSGDRIVLAAELYLSGKVKQILISAGSSRPIAGSASEAEHTSVLLQRFGIPPGDILIESASGNTYENARESGSILQSLSLSPRPQLLVTSAFHMTRARALFCKAGIDTIGVSANHWINPASKITPGNWFFQAHTLSGSSRILREYMGILVYGLTNRLDLSTLSHDKQCLL